MFKLLSSIILILIIQHTRAKREATALLELSFSHCIKPLSFLKEECPSSEAGTQEIAALYCSLQSCYSSQAWDSAELKRNMQGQYTVYEN